MLYTFKTANEAWSICYDELGRNIEDHAIDSFYTSNPRGRKCNETVGTSLLIIDPKNCLVWSKLRQLSPIYLAKECLWYQSGDRNPDNAPSKVWDGLKNKDGDEKGLINSNYGSYIFTQKDNKNPELSVYEATIELLKRDPDSRQAIWQIPIMKHRQDDDTPCTSSLQFLLRDGKLNCITYMRSCDIWFGFPNDISQFIIWQMMVARDLDVELGTYTHHFGSFHCYEENFISDKDSFNEISDSEYKQGKEGLPYFIYYDDRDYRIILQEILDDFEVLSSKSKNEILENNLIKNEELKYMLNNMTVKKFIH